MGAGLVAVAGPAKRKWMSYDDWKMRVPEHEESEDYADTVKRFCQAHEQEIDNILDACAEIEPDARELDISDFRDAADCVADFIGAWLIGFKRTDRLHELRKRDKAKPKGDCYERIQESESGTGSIEDRNVRTAGERQDIHELAHC